MNSRRLRGTAQTPEEALQRIADLCVEDILSMSDEEILAEATETDREGIVAVRRLIVRVLEEKINDR